MELDEVIRRRRMHRDFSDRPVEPELVDRLLDRARRAPSAGHTQGWAFLVLQGPAQVHRFWRATADPDWLAAPTLPGLLKAPVVVVPLASEAAYRDRYSQPDKTPAGPAGGWSVPYWTVDVSFATMLLLLAVVDVGLGALFFGMRPGAAESLRDEFGVPPEWEPIGAVALGWPSPDERPSGSATRRPRRPWEEVVHRGGW